MVLYQAINYLAIRRYFKLYVQNVFLFPIIDNVNPIYSKWRSEDLDVFSLHIFYTGPDLWKNISFLALDQQFEKTVVWLSLWMG